MNPLVSHGDGRRGGGERCEGARTEGKKRDGYRRGREREREESVEAPVSRRLEPAVVVPLYACEPRRRDIAPRDAHAGWEGEGARGRGHRVGAERDYRCKSPRTKGSLLVALME